MSVKDRVSLEKIKDLRDSDPPNSSLQLVEQKYI